MDGVDFSGKGLLLVGGKADALLCIFKNFYLLLKLLRVMPIDNNGGYYISNLLIYFESNGPYKTTNRN